MQNLTWQIKTWNSNSSVFKSKLYTDIFTHFSCQLVFKNPPLRNGRPLIRIYIFSVSIIPFMKFQWLPVKNAFLHSNVSKSPIQFHLSNGQIMLNGIIFYANPMDIVPSGMNTYTKNNQSIPLKFPVMHLNGRRNFKRKT